MWMLDSTYTYSDFTRDKCNLGSHAAVIYDEYISAYKFFPWESSL